jgi:hypothetical protein
MEWRALPVVSMYVVLDGLSLVAGGELRKAEALGIVSACLGGWERRPCIVSGHYRAAYAA